MKIDTYYLEQKWGLDTLVSSNINDMDIKKFPGGVSNNTWVCGSVINCLFTLHELTHIYYN